VDQPEFVEEHLSMVRRYFLKIGFGGLSARSSSAMALVGDDTPEKFPSLKSDRNQIKRAPVASRTSHRQKTFAMFRVASRCLIPGPRKKNAKSD